MSRKTFTLARPEDVQTFEKVCCAPLFGDLCACDGCKARRAAYPFTETEACNFGTMTVTAIDRETGTLTVAKAKQKKR